MKHSLSFRNTSRLAFAFFLALLSASAAQAVTATFQVLMDFDPGTGTGCTVATTAGNVSGVDRIEVVTVDTFGGASAQVSAVETRSCTAPPSTFSAPASVVGAGSPPIPATPYPAGIGNGQSGQNVIEAAYPLELSGNPSATEVRLAVVGSDGGVVTDALIATTPGGNVPIVLPLFGVAQIPTLNEIGLFGLGLLLAAAALVVLRRRRSASALLVAFLLFGLSGLAFAAASDLNGATTAEWGAPLATDPSGPPDPPGADIVAFFAMKDTPAGLPGRLYFRIDSSLVFNQAPAAVDDAGFTTFEDTPLNQAAPGVLGNDTDPDGPPPLSAILVSGPAHAASFALNADGSFNYTPAANYNGPDSFTYQAQDGLNSLSNTATVSITVNPVNDAPSFTKGPDVTVLQNAPAQTVDPWATALSAGPTADESPQTLTFTVTGNTNPALFSAGPAVSPTGALTFTPSAGAVGSATLTLTLSDSGGTANGGVDTSAAQTFVITVSDVNDAPSFTKGADQTVLEDAGAQTVNPWATAISPGPPSESGQVVTFNVTGNTNPALFSAGPAVSSAGVLTFTPAANANGTATITLVAMDDGGTALGGVDTSAAQSFVITVTAVNDAPSFTKGADQTVLEDAGAQTVNPWATAISAGPADESSQTLTFNVTGNTNPALFSVPPSISPAGVLTYTPAANTSGSATISLTLSDNGGTANGGADTSAAQSFVITVSDINDAPSFTKGADQTVLEDAGAQTANPWATAISAGPASESGQTLTFNVTGNTNPALFSAAPAVSSTGVLTYTPAANATGTATITLVLMDNGGTANGGIDTSAPQSFVITVTAVNDAPSFTKGPDQTVLEDSGPHAANPWATAISAGPADESGQTLTFNVTGNTNPSLFSVAPAVSSAGVLTFTPAANASGTATITLTLTDNGGTANGGADTSAAQSFTITVSDINDAPSFTKGADQTVLEDAGAQTVNPWATAISPGPASESGQTVTFNITGNTNPGLFSAGPAVSPTGVLTYTPAANANGSATITLVLMDNGGTANGGIDTSASQSFVINVTAVNDAPSFTKGADQTVNEDSGAQTVNPWATAISAGPANESGQTLTFNVTGNSNPGLFSAGPAVSSTGVLTYTPAPNASGTATVTLALMDNGGTANGGVDTSASQSFVITVNNVNDAPSFTKGADQTVNEDAGAQTVNPWATAISPGPPSEAGQAVTFNITGNTNPGLFSAGPAVSPTGVLTYTPAANAFGSATITLVAMDNGGTANGGVDTSAAQSFTITVNPVNDPPSFTKGADQTVLEDSGAQTVNPWATGISPGPANESGQTVSFNITGNTNPGLFSAGPAVSSTGVLTYTPAVNTAGTATITLVAMDNGGTANGGVDTSAAQSFTITVTGVNDPPSFVKGADQTVNEDAGPQTVNPWATAISAGPPDESGQTVSIVIDSNSNPGLFSAGPAVSPTGVLTYTSALNAFGTATISLHAMDNGGTANGGVDFSATQTFTITVNPVNDPPVADNDQFDFIGNTELRVDLAAVATPHVLATTPSTNGVLDGDSDPVEGDAIQVSALTVGSCTDASSPFDCADAAIGTVHLQTNGKFSFEPAPGVTGAAPTGCPAGAIDKFVFTYVLTDNGTPAPASAAPATVTLCRFERVWYVDPAAGAGGNGTSLLPLNSFATLNGAGGAGDSDAAGDYIFVHAGSLSIASPLELEANQHFLGKGVGLSIPFGLNGNPSPTNLVAAGAQPQITNATGDAVKVTQAMPIEIRGLSLASTTGNAIDLTSAAALTGSATLTITNDTIRNAGAEGVDVNLNAGTTGTVAINFSNNAWDAAGTHTGNGFDARTAAAGVNLRLAFSNNSPILSTGASGLFLDGTAGGTVTITGFANNVFHQNTVGNGASINTATFDSDTATAGLQQVAGGTTVVGASGNGVGGSGMVLTNVSGDLAFTDLDIFNDAGAGLLVSGTGVLTASTGTRVSVGAGVSTIDSNGGPAVSINNSSVSLPMGFLRSTNSTTTGLSLVSAFGGVGSTALSASSGQISDPVAASGIAVNIDGGNGNVTLGIPVTSTSGQSVSITNRTSDTVSFTSTISDTGGGVFMNNNGGATMSYSSTLTINTGTNPGFTATGGGTVTATDSGNTLATTTATALNVANTQIGAGGLVFRSIAVNGASKGIILNSTGTAAGNGGLTVNGTGATDGSGGTIQNVSARGGEFITTKALTLKNINFTNANTTDGGTCNDLSTTACNAVLYLNGVSGATLDNLNISGTTAQQGINGISVSNFSLANSNFANCGTSGTVEEGCIKMRELTGTCSITNSDLSFPGADVVEIVNSTGPALTLNVSGSTFRDSQSSAAGNTGLQARAEGTSSMVLNVTSSSFLRIRTVGLHATAIGTASNDVDVTNNTFDPGTGTMIGMDLDADNTATLVFNVQNNLQIYSRNGPAINVFGDTSATINGRINNNPDVQVKSNVGSNVGSGIRANINKNATARIEVKNNVVNVGSDDAGIDLSAIGKTAANPGGATNTLDATVTGNNVTIGATSTYGIIILSATNAGDTNALCADVGTNAITRNPSSIASFRARVPSANGFFRMNNFVTNAEATWNAKGNTPVSAGGSEVSFGGSGTFATCTAALPTNPGPN